MLASVLSRGKPDVERSARIFFGPDSTIVVAMHRSAQGVDFEQPEPCVIPGQPAPAQLGEAFAKAFAAFSVVRSDVPLTKKSDWPGFKASGCRSIKQFETQYVSMLCSSLNATNAVVRASVPHPANAELEIAWHFNPLMTPDAIGRGLVALAALGRAS